MISNPQNTQREMSHKKAQKSQNESKEKTGPITQDLFTQRAFPFELFVPFCG
jgi:hypothetical protein